MEVHEHSWPGHGKEELSPDGRPENSSALAVHAEGSSPHEACPAKPCNCLWLELKNHTDLSQEHLFT